MDEQDKGEFTHHSSCSNCGSSDGRANYTNGTSYCFVCEEWAKTSEDGYNATTRYKGNTVSKELLHIDYKYLKSRAIPEDICKQYRYGVASDTSGKRCQVATYFNKDKEPIAQKLRYPDKTFKFIGVPKEAGLYGQQLWGDNGLKLTITEGEIDALSVATAFDGKYPVVSIPNGSQSAKREISKQIEWISSFKEIYLWFDNDEQGRKAVEECLLLLPAGKVKVITHSEFKDANDVLVNEGKKGVVQAFYNATTHRPDGVMSPEELLEEVSKPVEMGIPWVFDELTKATFGRRKGEIYGIGAGVGIGKTDFLTQQIAYDINTLNRKVGLFFLEQKPSETLRRIAGKIDGTAYHIPNEKWSQDELNTTVKTIIDNNNLFLYNNFGSATWDIIEHKIRYMVHSLEVEFIYLDHLTAMSSHENDERRYLDGLMENIASLAQELNIVIHFVSHLTTPSTGSHEEGARVEAKHFRGSRSIMQWAYILLGLERNNQHADVEERKKTIIRVLKERYTGQGVGKTVSLKYNTDSFMLEETSEVFDDLFVEDGEDY